MEAQDLRQFIVTGISIVVPLSRLYLTREHGFLAAIGHIVLCFFGLWLFSSFDIAMESSLIIMAICSTTVSVYLSDWGGIQSPDKRIAFASGGLILGDVLLGAYNCLLSYALYFEGNKVATGIGYLIILGLPAVLIPDTVRRFFPVKAIKSSP